MTFLHRFSIRHPATVLVVAILVVMAIAPGVLRLKLRTDGYALVPAERPEVVFDREVRDEFKSEDVIVVLIRSEHPDGVYTADTVGFIQRLTREFQALEGIEPYNVSSLETEYSHRVKQGTLTFRRFLDPLPQTREQLATLRNDLDKIGLYTGTIVSYDGSASAIFVGVPDGVDRTELYGRVQDVIAAEGPRDEEIHVIGAPVAEALLGLHILEDLGVPRGLLGLPATGEEAEAGWHWPASMYELRLLIGRHVGLVPVAIVIMAVVFVAAFRSPTAAALPLAEVGACLVTVFGLMGWLGVPVYLTIAVMPVILTAIGVADEIHIFSRYTQELRATRGQPHRETLRATMDEMWVPVVKTSVTTAVGFLSFALSPLGPVRAFGVFTAVGIIFCMLWSLTAVPAMLALMNPQRFVKPVASDQTGPSRSARVFAGLATRVVRARHLIVVLAVIALAVAPFGVNRVLVQDSWINGFAPDSEFYQATQSFNEQFLGSHILMLRVETPQEILTGEMPASALDHHTILLPPDLVSDSQTLVGHRITMTRKGWTKPSAQSQRAPGRPRPVRTRIGTWTTRIIGAAVGGEHLVVSTERRRGSPRIALRPEPDDVFEFEIRVEPLTDPEVIRRIDGLETFIKDRTDLTVGGVIGTASLLTTTHYMARGLKEDSRHIPDTADRIQWLWAQYKRIRGPERLQQVVDPNYAHSLVTVYLKNANFVDVQKLMDAIRVYEAQHLAPHHITLGFAGDVAVSQTLIRAIVETQVLSLAGSLVGIVLVTSLLAGSLRWGLLSVLPCALAVMINFAAMGWTQMPLGVATSMFAGMTLGIGVDYAIHLLERYRWARRQGLAEQEAVTDAMSATGPAIVIDALAVAAGFGILTLSQVPANARLGALVVLSIAGCLAATLLLLPALLRLWPPRVRTAPP